jgi:hypothetical protein
VTGGVQQRLDVQGYALPLDPHVLADLSEFEVAHVLACLDLDDEQRDCAEQAVAAVLAGVYGRAGR